jgi:hypothetical protein
MGKKYAPDRLIDLTNNRPEWKRWLSNNHDEDERVEMDCSDIQRRIEEFKNLRKLSSAKPWRACP